MEHPKIADARAIVEKRQAVGGIVILFYQDADDEAGRYGLASYGVDKTRCALVGRIAEQIGDEIESGIIAVPSLAK